MLRCRTRNHPSLLETRRFVDFKACFSPRPRPCPRLRPRPPPALGSNGTHRIFRRHVKRGPEYVVTGMILRRRRPRAGPHGSRRPVVAHPARARRPRLVNGRVRHVVRVRRAHHIRRRDRARSKFCRQPHPAVVKTRRRRLIRRARAHRSHVSRHVRSYRSRARRTRVAAVSRHARSPQPPPPSPPAPFDRAHFGAPPLATSAPLH